QPRCRAWPDPAQLSIVLEKLNSSKYPVLIGGHGVWWAGAEHKLEQAGKTLGIPIFNIPYHQKLLGEDCEAYMGLADVHQYHPSADAFKKSDLVMMVGARLDNQMNFGNPPLFPDTTNLLCVNGSHEELDLNRAADFLLLCDPRVFLDALIEHAANQNVQLSKNWFMENRAARSRWVKKMVDEVDKEASEPKFGGRIHPLHLALDVQAAIDDGNWLVIDGGNTHFWSEIAINIAGFNGKKLGGILHPGTFSLLGVGVSFAVAAKNVHPEQNVILISGDGAFLSGGLSIEAAFQEHHPIVVVVDNNGGLDCISQQQERLFANGSHFATDFRDIPFHSMFEGLGGYGELVTKRQEIIPAIKRAIASGKTACVNVKTQGVISPIVLATTSKRDKASIE
ncbi:MAG: thiamine pyrophosphate-dependent enzyme, partial [Pseudomonadota bacterium]|nr:thiamine pyrophosphate-dependent enzyme [Pseudomonadota bacterium]